MSLPASLPPDPPSRAPARPASGSLRLRDLALLPALILLIVIGASGQPGLSDRRQHHHHSRLVGGAGAGGAGRIADRDHRQVRPVARIDGGLRAGDRRDAGRCRRPISASAWSCRPAIGLSRCSSSARWSASSTASWWSVPAQRLHRHPGHADHPARHAGRRDQRPHAVRPAAAFLRLMTITCARPAVVGVAGGAGVSRRRLSCCATIAGPRAVCDRRQSRGGARRRHSGRARHLGRLCARRHAGLGRRPGRSPAMSGRSAPIRATA